jgi:hypothetical protein
MLWRARSAARRQRIVLEQMPIALIALSRARQTRQRRLVSLTALPFFISRHYCPVNDPVICCNDGKQNDL